LITEQKKPAKTFLKREKQIFSIGSGLEKLLKTGTKKPNKIYFLKKRQLEQFLSSAVLLIIGKDLRNPINFFELFLRMD